MLIGPAERRDADRIRPTIGRSGPEAAAPAPLRGWDAAAAEGPAARPARLRQGSSAPILIVVGPAAREDADRARPAVAVAAAPRDEVIVTVMEPARPFAMR